MSTTARLLVIRSRVAEGRASGRPVEFSIIDGGRRGAAARVHFAPTGFQRKDRASGVWDPAMFEEACA
jgi:hypothetical protein